MHRRVRTYRCIPFFFLMNKIKPLSIALLSLFLISCENDRTGTIDPLTTLPYLTNVTLPLEFIDIDNDTTGIVENLPDNRYKVRITFNGEGFSLKSGEAIKGSLEVYKPNATSAFKKESFETVASGPDSVRFSSSVLITIDRGDAGKFQLIFSLNAGLSSESNIVEKSIWITRNNSKPRLLQFSAPDTIVRPTTGTKLLHFNCTASDSDGYPDLRRVYIKRISPTETNPIDLYDNGDGINTGDAVAYDGIFSRILSIDSTARTGDQIFLFRAEDKSGAISDSLLHSITILP